MSAQRLWVTWLVAAMVAAVPVVTIAVEGTPGAISVGDPIVPWQGNGGFDVSHYDLDLRVDPVAGGIIAGEAVVTAEATQDLSAFSLDFVGLQIGTVEVDGVPASFERIGPDLIIEPTAVIPAGEVFETRVTYRGEPTPGPDQFVRGWWHEGESIFIVGEPAGAERWFPVNGHPSDGATYDLRLSVPERFTVVASGEPIGSSTADGWTTTEWSVDREIPPYTMSFVAAEMTVEERAGPDGIELVVAYPTGTAPEVVAPFSKMPEMIETLSACFGPLPVDRFGGVVVSDAFGAALEAENIPIYGIGAVEERTIAHEMAHQWFGNDVRLASWKDLWLNEGFARYAEVLWVEATEGEAAKAEMLAQQREQVLFFHGPVAGAIAIADPEADGLFNGYIYSRGALTLQALRDQVGDPTFCTILRTWHEEHAGTTGSTAEFIATAERLSGQDLTAFFEEWIFSAEVPESIAAIP